MQIAAFLTGGWLRMGIPLFDMAGSEKMMRPREEMPLFRMNSTNILEEFPLLSIDKT